MSLVLMVWGRTRGIIALLHVSAVGPALVCEMSSLRSGCSESEVVQRSGRLPQLQSHRAEKGFYEIVQRLQRAAEATDAPLSCGEGIPYTHTLWYSLWIGLFPNDIFLSWAHARVCVCVCECVWVCDLLWDLKRGWWHWAPNEPSLR